MLSIVVHQLTISSLGPLIFAEIITTLASNCSFWQVIDDQYDYMSGTKNEIDAASTENEINLGIKT